MLQKDAARALNDEINVLLSPLCGVAGLYELARETLVKARQGPSSAASRPWPLLPLLVCDSLSGDVNQVIPAAAAIEFFKAAAEVFDDIEDADSPGSLASTHGGAIATNTATLLVVLGEKAIARLKDRGVANSTIINILDTFNSYYITACAGQHLDLSAKQRTENYQEIYLGILEMKSASQVECACWLGATLAGAQPKLVGLFSRFGQALGIAVQIANDIRGVTEGNDIMERKITLPAIYALTQTSGKVREQLGAAFFAPPGAATDVAPTRDILFNTGAIHYSTTVMELYRQQALGALSEAENSGARVERLRQFIG
jgi:geranylgeranyl pyrophosphate synthase